MSFISWPSLIKKYKLKRAIVKIASKYIIFKKVVQDSDLKVHKLLNSVYLLRFDFKTAKLKIIKR